jgi:hypothetical protein
VKRVEDTVRACLEDRADHPVQLAARRADLEHQAERLAGEVSKLVAAVAGGADLKPLTDGLKARQAELDTVRARLEHLDGLQKGRGILGGGRPRESDPGDSRPLPVGALHLARANHSPGTRPRRRTYGDPAISGRLALPSVPGAAYSGAANRLLWQLPGKAVARAEGGATASLRQPGRRDPSPLGNRAEEAEGERP